MNNLSKKDVRKKIIAQRDILSEEEIRERSEIIKNKLFDIDEYKNAKNIFLFTSFGSEVDTHEIIRQALRQGKRVAVPRVNKETKLMEAKIIDNLEDMAEGYYGILEPSEAAEEMSPESIDLIIMPGVAFDLKGGRIGYGAGFYDKFLKEVSESTPKIAIAYELQLIEEVPMESYDVRIDGVITEKRITIFKKSSF
ncbi:5-formyltetrahydrofolate cyclo-ligase [Clostridium polynesiense]|uniref:5-formyltetrahydrofolate cyclo-ligase n=1 Tax=Clostridium polynesiense TaxID=1325933 RepID=UPI00058BBCE5|nr:5-formyltetrahydrofolate cyclo-ligase [Clostridium polynesiense]